ncbi:MAG: 4Fe-4S binding protein [Deltaproteobacteria bacterium]|nr:4Fe-4S binding protein [Deltaproteobacteria bacterium]
MEQKDQVYVKLQQHLDSQAVGFPATKSGVELKILKHIFTPQEAEIACFLNYRMEALETIYPRVKHLVGSKQELEEIFDGIQKKGGIESKSKNGENQYSNAPLVVGMYEFQNYRLTPEFIKDFNKYTADMNFGIDFISTELPQMRTIPIAKSLHPEHQVSTFDEVTTLLKQAEGPFVIVECICRKKKSMGGKSCKKTDRKETCLAIGEMAQMTLNCGYGREITRDETMSIIEQNQRDGLVLQPSNTKKAEFICSCCGCCCGMLSMHKSLPKPVDFWATNFHAVVDQNTCEGSGNCEESCQVGAVHVSEKELYAVVNLDRCLGCGVCVSSCPTESISLLKKPSEVIPPQTREELVDIIMAHKKGRFGKLMLTGKLYFDAVRTGHTHLFKS